jgi:hypothetical protein
MWITFEFFLNYVENTRNPEQVGIYLMLYSSVLLIVRKRGHYFYYGHIIKSNLLLTGGTVMKGYSTESGFMGLVGDRYMLFSCEEDYIEYLQDEPEEAA